MPKAQKDGENNKKHSKRKRKPSDPNERFLNRMGKRMVRKNLDNPAVRAAFIGKGLGIPLRADDFPDPFIESLKTTLVKALIEDLKSPDPRIRESAALHLRRFSDDNREYPKPRLPRWAMEWRRRGRPRKEQA